MFKKYLTLFKVKCLRKEYSDPFDKDGYFGVFRASKTDRFSCESFVLSNNVTVIKVRQILTCHSKHHAKRKKGQAKVTLRNKVFI